MLDYQVVRDGDAGSPAVKLTGWPVNVERLQTDARVLAARRGFLRRHATGDGLRLKLKGVYLRDSLLWLTLDVQERTAMGCGPGTLRLYTEDRRKVKRTATQELDILPVYAQQIGAVAGFSHQATAIGMRPLVVGRGKRLVIAFTDTQVDRQIVLKVKGKVLMKARRVN